MRKIIQHPVYGKIIYTEGFWTGKKDLAVPGHDVHQVSKRSFLVDGKSALLIGSYLGGMRLSLDGETIEISAKPKWYEFVLAILPFIFILVWGNSAALCSIFPVIGGAIGGAIGGIGIVASLLLMKKSTSAINKILIGIGVFAATVFVAFLLALAFLALAA